MCLENKKTNLWKKILVISILTSLLFHFPIFSENVSAEPITYSTDFNVTKDGYNFENYRGDYSSGYCYGMSMTSILYYLELKERPGGVDCTYDVNHDGVDNIIHAYQETFEEVIEDQNLVNQLYMSLDKKYKIIKQNIMNDTPVVLGLYLSASMGGVVGHAIVAYEIVELDENNILIYTYDPNYCYDNSNDYLQYVTLNLDAKTFNYTGNIGGSVYNEYSLFLVIEPQLSHTDVFWMENGLIIYVSIGIIVAVVIFLVYRWYRKLKQKAITQEYKEKEANKTQKDEAVCIMAQEIDDDDSDGTYTQEELEEFEQKSRKGIVPPNMVLCSNCGTINIKTDKQCRICAEELEK